MPGYKQPCRFCSEFIDGDANTCPLCGRDDPFTLRCPVCRNPVEENWARCSSCGLAADVRCEKCGKDTFPGLSCMRCGASLGTACKNCGSIQPAGAEKCGKCKKPMK